MSMTKKNLIALADALKLNAPDPDSNALEIEKPYFEQIVNDIANACAEANPNFNRQRWLHYIAGKCGSNGGAIKPPRAVSLAQLEHEESGCTNYLQHRAQDCPYLH